MLYAAGSGEGGFRMYRQAADGSDTPVPLFEEDDLKASQIPEEATPDGSLLVFTRSADGSELFFTQGDLLMSAAVERVGESGLPTFGPPRRVLDRKALGLGFLRDVHPQDGRFFFVTKNDKQGPREIHVVLNWFEELKRRTSN